MTQAILLEVCVDHPASLSAAVRGGADRIELCSALNAGGLTPSAGFMELAAVLHIPVHAMIRGRSGTFIYDADELSVMESDIQTAKSAGLAGVVFGVTTEDGTLDISALSRLMLAADGMDTTLHRAVDLCPDPLGAVEDAVQLGFDRILTSGGAETAEGGQNTIADMVRIANGRLTIMAGSGLKAENVGSVVKATGVSEVHASCARSVPHNGKSDKLGFGSASLTDDNQVRQMRQALDAISDIPMDWTV